MAKVTPAIPAIGLPWKSVVLPLKFTRRGTGADDCVDAPCWAATREQNIELVRSMESENLQDFMAHLNSSRFFRSHAGAWCVLADESIHSICQPFSAISGFSSPICNGGKHWRI